MIDNGGPGMLVNMMPYDNCFEMYLKIHFKLHWRSSRHFSFVCLNKTVLSEYGSKCYAGPRNTTPLQMQIPLTSFDVFWPIRVKETLKETCKIASSCLVKW